MLNPHPLVFTVRATTCVYSDSLDWLIDFTPHFTLRYIENNGPVKLYKMQALSDCVYLPYLNTTLIWGNGCLYYVFGIQVFKGFFGKLLFRIIIIYWDWKYHLPSWTSMMKNWLDFLRPVVVFFLRMMKIPTQKGETQANVQSCPSNKRGNGLNHFTKALKLRTY